MAIDIPVPSLGESVTEATVAKWLKKKGDSVRADETIAELETDKVTLEVNAPQSGTLIDITVPEGANVKAGGILGKMEAGEVRVAPANDAKESSKPVEKPAASHSSPPASKGDSKDKLSPAVMKIVEENKLNPRDISGTGKDGRLTKGDVLQHMESPKASPSAAAIPAVVRSSVPAPEGRAQERVKMTKLRQTIARRLKEAQNTAALLTTFNDVDMGRVMDLRAEYKDAFEKKYGVKLGFMSFFVKAAVQALKEFPAVNGTIDGEDVVYRNYYDIGVAVGTDQGLVVPVVRDCEHKTFAQVEQEVGDLAIKARNGQLSMADLTGGTFTITNGGVYGSLMSTPIINPPQSAILGMHRIEKRPVVDAKDNVVVRPMMYLALTYDHRIIDGSESVRFLKTIKEAIEDPQRLILGV